MASLDVGQGLERDDFYLLVEELTQLQVSAELFVTESGDKGSF